MKIIIKTKNLDQSEALNNFIEKKFETLNKYKFKKYMKKSIVWTPIGQ